MMILFLILSLLANISMSNPEDVKITIETVCRVTRYRELCMRTLGSHPGTFKQSPQKWAHTSVSAALGEAKRVALYLKNLKKHKALRGRKRVALEDCIECFEDSIQIFRDSLGILRRLNRKKKGYGAKVSDLETWMSGALTSEDTCLEGFSGREKAGMVQRRVMITSYMTSNALAVITRLLGGSHGGVEDIDEP